MIYYLIGKIYSSVAQLNFKTYLKFHGLLAKWCYPGYTKDVFADTLKEAGIEINGKNAWDIQVKDEQFYWHSSTFGTLELAESYMKGWIECKDLLETCSRLVHPKILQRVMSQLNRMIYFMVYRFWEMQTAESSKQTYKAQEERGNDFYKVMLDPTLSHSCAYWKNAKNLEEAQIAKMELIARKLKLEPGMKVLDIGSGWGSLAKYLAEKHNAQVVGYNISEEQVSYSRKLCKGLNVEIRHADYRNIEEKFDRIVCVEMLELVGEGNYNEFFEICHRCLIDGGIFLLHTVGINHADMSLTEPFTNTHMFPHSSLPYHQHITKYSQESFIIEDWHNFGIDYGKTMEVWYKNLVEGWPKVKHKYQVEFFRMWTLYLGIARALFLARKVQVWQIVFSKGGIADGYEAVR